MANKEREMKLALINKEEIEGKLAKLEEMLPKEYLSDEVHDLLRSEYASIKEQSDRLLTNLEELNSSERIIDKEYVALKNEYNLINSSSARLLANKSEGSISEELYNSTKREYSKELDNVFLALAGIKREIRKIVSAEESEIKRYNDELEKIAVRYKTGEIKPFDHDRQRDNYQKKIEGSQKSISGLNKLLTAESSKDIAVEVKRQGHPVSISMPSNLSVSIPPSLSGLNEKLPQGVHATGIIGSLRAFISGLKDRYWGLSPTYRIAAGFLTWTIGPSVYALLLSPIMMWGFYRIATGNYVSGILLLVIFGIGIFGILIPGMLMFIYGVRDAWRERSS